MQGDVLKDFLARLGFKVDEASAKRFNQSLASTTKRLAVFGAAIQAVTGGVYAAVYKVAQQEARFLALSDATGVAVETLQELDYVAQQTDSSTDKLTSSIQGLQKAMGEATIGKGGLEAFHRLGIRVRDANGGLRDTVDVLFEVGEKIKGMDAGKRSMFMSQLGIDLSLVRMLTEDVTGLRATYQEMYRASGIDARQAAEDSRAYLDEIHTIKTVLGMVAKSVSMAFIGKMRADLTRLRKAIIENFSKITAVFQGVIRLIMRIAGTFGALTMRILQWVGWIADAFGRLDPQLQTVILGVLGFAAAWKWLNLAFLATPLGMFIALAAVVVGLIDDFQTWLEGGESLLDWGGSWQGMLGLLVGGLAAFKAALIAVPAVMSAVSTAAAFMGTVIRAVGLAFAANPIGFVLTLMAMAAIFIITHWSTLKRWFASFAAWLTDLWGGVGESVRSKVRLLLAIIGGPVLLVIRHWSRIKGFFSGLWDGVVKTFHTAADAVRRPFEIVFAWFEKKIGWLMDAVTWVADTAVDIADAVTDAAGWVADGVSGMADWFTGGPAAPTGPALVPAPAMASAGHHRGGDTTLDAKTNIYVQGTSSPEATARAVGHEQTRVNADLVRNAKGAAR